MTRLILIALALSLSTSLLADSYSDEIEHWRATREQKLKADDGWLTLTGLYWLKEGRNTVGSDPASAVVLPSSAPARFGDLSLAHGAIHLDLSPGATATVNGAPASSMDLKDDENTKPDLVQSGSWTFLIIHRGARWGVRLKDRNSAYRREFKGLNWYPVDPAFRITARFTPYDTPKKVIYESKVNEPEEMTSPGYITFSWNGQEFRLEPVQEDNELFFVFKDQTSPRETYGGGRFLYSAMPKGGVVIVDFNKAYNPPCVFTPYATCPLPRPENRMTIPIRAGEKIYHGPEDLLNSHH